MERKIELNKIQIFSYISGRMLDRLQAVFIPQIIPKDQFLTIYGEEVQGLYILVEGQVTVLGQDQKTPLATLNKGASFGEMSFLQPGYKASAHIVVSSEMAEVLFCQKEVFREVILKEPNLSNPFYKGAAILIADRLRHANSEIIRGYHFVSSVLDESGFDFKLGKTRSILNETGSKIISGLLGTLPMIDTIIEKYPSVKNELEEVHDKIESVLLAEGQNFDRLAQQLDHILQHFANLKCIVNGGIPQDISGDTMIFDERPSVGAEDFF
jgi:hypothetical protein